ncbi:MAG: (d)CMP kinase [Aquificae bacterium]|nr:(d)CMP kinase [Aquificota bacterium]
MIVAIDGPAGSGKSTVAKLVAQKLGFSYIDTGAMYRAVAYKLIKDKISVEDVSTVLDGLNLQFIEVDNQIRIILDGEDITDKIRTEQVGKVASQIATIPEVRKALVKLQRNMALQKENAVLEGRDIGTVVFPNADLKIFLTAQPEERARRRYIQLKEKGLAVSYEEILKMILNRDKNDTQRKEAPLKPSKDAIILDTTGKSIDEVVDFILEKAKKLKT